MSTSGNRLRHRNPAYLRQIEFRRYHSKLWATFEKEVCRKKCNSDWQLLPRVCNNSISRSSSLLLSGLAGSSCHSHHLTSTSMRTSHESKTTYTIYLGLAAALSSTSSRLSHRNLLVLGQCICSMRSEHSAMPCIPRVIDRSETLALAGTVGQIWLHALAECRSSLHLIRPGLVVRYDHMAGITLDTGS